MHAVLLVQNLIELTFASLAGGCTLITLNPALANVYTDYPAPTWGNSPRLFGRHFFNLLVMPEINSKFIMSISQLALLRDYELNIKLI